MARGEDLAQEPQLQRSFVSEVFHNLSQPLTALHCTLELSLHRDQSADELRGSIQTALENAGRLRQRLLLIRALNDACDPGDAGSTADLNALLRDLHDDTLPLFESEGSKFDVTVGREAVVVRADHSQVTSALFYFVEYLFRYSAQGAVTAIQVAASGTGQAELRITSGACLPISPSDAGDAAPYSCEIEMMRRTFRAAGGDFELISGNAHRCVWRGTLPLA